MTHFNKVAILALAIPTLGACQFYARSADDYASATKEVLAQKEDQIKSCYDDVLASDAKAKGIVAVNFTVEAKTGAIKDPAIDSEQTTAPESLQQCVLSAMNGLVLDPPDQRQGVASFAYDFSANEAKQL